MAQTTYALITSFLPDIWEAALMYAQENFFMPSLVTVFNDSTSDVARKGTAYSAGTVGTLSEGVQIPDTQTFARSAFGTLTPAEYGTSFEITDNRMESDDVDNIMADLAQHIGYTFGKHVEGNLVGCFASFTGGSVGTGGTADPMTWDRALSAEAILDMANVPGPYSLVISKYQALDLNIVTSTNLPGVYHNDSKAQRDYLASLGMFDIFGTGQIAAGTIVKGGMFSRDAIALDIRRALRLEFVRGSTGALKRSTFAVPTMKYAYGPWRADHGVVVVSDGSAPS